MSGSEYGCDGCGTEVPDGAGIYVNDDTERMCAKCAESGEHDAVAQQQWLAKGCERGWVGPPVCSTHDGTPTTADEDDLFDNGEDTCVFVVRLYHGHEERLAVESNHPPSRWRATRQSAGADEEGNNH